MYYFFFYKLKNKFYKNLLFDKQATDFKKKKFKMQLTFIIYFLKKV